MAGGASIIFMAPGLSSPVFARLEWISRTLLFAEQSPGLSRNRIPMVDGVSLAFLRRSCLERDRAKVRLHKRLGPSWDSCRQGWQTPSVSLAASIISSGTKRKDGSWEEVRHTGTGFPRVFYLRYHWYCQYFPLWALAMYRNLRTRGTMRADELRQQVFASGCHRADH